MTSPQQTVFLVDDDDSIRISLSRALTKRGFTVEAYASADKFLNAFDPERSGCLVLDYGMPDMNGLELQQRLLEDGATLPIIFITGHGGIPESVQAIKSGAVDFLEKPFRQSILVERIGVAFKLDLENRNRDASVSDAREAFNRLTDREREIAELMVAQPSNSSSKGLARALDISPRTVDHHRARIMEKMNVRSVAELVNLAVRADLAGKQSSGS